MKEIWDNFNLFLNCYGGLISAVSLVFSVFIYFKTGQIRRSIKNFLNHDNYEKAKKQSKKKLEGILESITEDNVLDEKLVGEINREIAILEHYSIFFDIKTKNNVKQLNKILFQSCNEIIRNKQLLITRLNKVIGDLEYRESYIG